MREGTGTPSPVPQRLRKTLKRYRPVLLVLLAGLVLLALPAGGGEEENVEADAGLFDPAADEARLAQALSRIRGAGEVTVLLSLSDGPRRILAEDREGEQETETIVLSKGGGGQETVTVQELSPSYRGALVICPGAGDADVRLALIQAVSTLTGLGTDKISVSQGN